MTAATGVAGSRPPAISSAAITARWETPISTTTVPPTLASERQSTSGSPARRWPVTTVNAAATPRWVTGTPAALGAPTADVTPGTTSNGTAGVEQRLGLLAATTEHVRVAALEADHPAPVAGQLDEQRRDQLLRDGTPGSLADVDQLGGRGDQRQHPVADQRVVHDDVGLGEQAGGLDGQQVGVAGSGADERDGDRPVGARRVTASSARRAGAAPADDRFGQPRGDRRRADTVRPLAERGAGHATRVGVAGEHRRQHGRDLVERHVGADALAEAVAGGRSADVDVVGLLGSPDDADLGVVRAGAPVRAARHVEADRGVTVAGVGEHLLQLGHQVGEDPLGLAEGLPAGGQGGAGDRQPAQGADVTGQRHAVAAQAVLDLADALGRDPVQQEVLAGRDAQLRHRAVGRQLAQRRAQVDAVTVGDLAGRHRQPDDAVAGAVVLLGRPRRQVRRGVEREPDPAADLGADPLDAPSLDEVLEAGPVAVLAVAVSRAAS